MKKGFITFINNNDRYLKLNDILLESILQFTDLEVEVNSINFNYRHSNKRVISKKINLDYENFHNICYSKILASLNTNFDIGLQLDADMIVTPEVKNLFNDISEDEEFILGSLHPHDPHNQQNIIDFLNIKEKTQPYIHATYLFTKNSKYFLQECFNLSNVLTNKNIIPFNADETILNCMLWKYKKTKNYVTTYDPYYEFFQKSQKEIEPHYPENFIINHYICHGIKDYFLAKNMFNQLKEKYEN